MMNHDQNELLSRFRLGDKEAFGQVFRLYVQPLRLNAYLILKNEQEAEDLVQQLFLDIWNQRLYQNIQSSLKAYLHTSVKNRCFNHLKKLSREAQHRQEYAGTQIPAYQVQLPDETAQRKLEGYRGIATSAPDLENDLNDSPIQVALSGLPAQQSKAFHLIHLQNKRYHEAATEMGISINSLKSHLKLAVKYVRGKLKASTIHPISK